MANAELNWPHYYWRFLKRVGAETYKTWRWELFSSVPLGYFAAVWVGDWKDFKTTLVATGMTLGCFVVWHILRVPWLLHKSAEVSETGYEPGALAGMLGVVVVAAMILGALKLGRVVWSARPLGVIEARIAVPSVPNIVQSRVVNVQEPCKQTVEQIKPGLAPQPCPGAPPPTLEEKVLAINAHFTEGDRNRFSNALADFSESLSQGETLGYKLNTELGSLNRAEADGTIAKDVQAHEKALSSISAEGWKYQKSFPALRTKWNMFREQVTYIFGDNPDNEGPNAIINGAEAYKNYLEWWDVIPNEGAFLASTQCEIRFGRGCSAS